MIHGHRVVAVIPARGGSKAIPGKNVRILRGKPLIAWAIETALQTPEIDRTVISTDSDAISELAQSLGADVFRRPAHLAQDNSLVADALRELAAQFKAQGESAEIMVLLEPTAPMRIPGDIQRCLEMLCGAGQQHDSVATFKAAEVHPWKIWKIEAGKPSLFLSDVPSWLPRQAVSPVYQANGAVYAFWIQRLPKEGPALIFGEAGAVLMPKKRSIDINTELDFFFAEMMMEQNAEHR